MRLTNTLKAHIVGKLAEKKFAAEEDDSLEEAELALKAYKAFAGGDLKTVRKLGKKWFEMGDVVHVGYIPAHGYVSLTMKHEEPMPAANYAYGYATSFAPGEGLKEEIERFLSRRDERKQARAEFKQKLNTIFAAVSTSKRLLEAWPEVAPFLPEETAQTLALVPVGLIQEVNAALGLEKPVQEGERP